MVVVECESPSKPEAASEFPSLPCLCCPFTRVIELAATGIEKRGKAHVGVSGAVLSALIVGVSIT